jgi:hypothetical protein
MGYHTEFDGHFDVTPPMSESLVSKINEFNNERHGGNIKPYPGFPGFWCQWMASDETTIEWDGGEKFYEYLAWLDIIIDRFLKPEGHVLNGQVYWKGEEFHDLGVITVRDNEVVANEMDW